MRRWTGVLLAVALLLAPAGGLGGVRQATAAGTQSVSTWVTLASANPAVGCLLDVSVEVRSGGPVLSGVEVLLGLVIDGELYSADRAVTDGDGIVYLTLDTGAAYAGGHAQIDVNIAGGYLGSAELALTDDGPCGDNQKLWSTTAELFVPDQIGSDDRGDAESGGAGEANGAFVWVPTYVQQRNLSCEYASLTIATGAFGAAVSEYEFDGLVGWSANPHWGYRGDITGWWGNTQDYGVYAEALVAPLAQYGFDGEVFYSLGDASELTARLDQGRPTLVWIALWGDLSEVGYTDDGTPFTLTAGAHVVVAYGYDEGGVFVSDPATGTTDYYDWGTFTSMWSVLDGMSLAVSPM